MLTFVSMTGYVRAMKQPCTYIMSSGMHGTLYVGVTSNLPARVHQHRTEAIKGFTSDHNIKRFVWFEMHETMEAAIIREKRLKNWHRDWKCVLIEDTNPQWDDLAIGLGFPPLSSS